MNSEVTLSSQPPSLEALHLAYGEASLVLIESLMLVLMDRGVLSSEDLLAAAELAIATKRQMLEDEQHSRLARLAAGALTTIANSVAASKVGRLGGEPRYPGGGLGRTVGSGLYQSFLLRGSDG